jgi:site-specific recombinase XerD
MKFLPIYSRHFAILHENFEAAIKTQGYSRGVGVTSPNYVKEFLFYLENRKITHIRKVKALDVIGYFDYLQERPNQRRGGLLSYGSIRTQLYAMRLFFDYLLKTGEIENSPARLPKFVMGSYKEMDILSVEQVQQLYAVSKNRFERALLSLAYGCGLRRTEMEYLNVSDVLFSKGIVNVRRAKGNKYRCVPVTDKVMGYLREYVVHEREKRFDPNVNCPSFFLNKYGGRLQGQALNRYLQEMVKRTGDPAIMNKEVSLHTLRRSISTHLIDNGAGMYYVKNFLGHEMLDTTHLYTKRRKLRIQM